MVFFVCLFALLLGFFVWLFGLGFFVVGFVSTSFQSYGQYFFINIYFCNKVLELAQILNMCDEIGRAHV